MSTSRRTLVARTLGSLSLVLTAVLATSQGAHAASRTVHDATGDTYVTTDVESDASPVRRPSTVGDILWVRTTHRHKAVDITIRVRDLSAGMNTSGIVIRTTKRHRPFVVAGAAVPGFHFAVLTPGLNSDRELKCPGLRMRFAVRDDVVRVHVPRSCIGSPRWVRTGAILMSAATDDPDSDEQVVDLAGANTVSDAWWQNDNAMPPLSPKVRVG